jgi:hypothetical protein
MLFGIFIFIHDVIGFFCIILLFQSNVEISVNTENFYVEFRAKRSHKLCVVFIVRCWVYVLTNIIIRLQLFTCKKVRNVNYFWKSSTFFISHGIYLW